MKKKEEQRRRKSNFNFTGFNSLPLAHVFKKATAARWRIVLNWRGRLESYIILQNSYFNFTVKKLSFTANTLEKNLAKKISQLLNQKQVLLSAKPTVIYFKFKTNCTVVTLYIAV